MHNAFEFNYNKIKELLPIVKKSFCLSLFLRNPGHFHTINEMILIGVLVNVDRKVCNDITKEDTFIFPHFAITNNNSSSDKKIRLQEKIYSIFIEEFSIYQSWNLIFEQESFFLEDIFKKNEEFTNNFTIYNSNNFYSFSCLDQLTWSRAQVYFSQQDDFEQDIKNTKFSFNYFDNGLRNCSLQFNENFNRFSFNFWSPIRFIKQISRDFLITEIHSTKLLIKNKSILLALGKGKEREQVNLSAICEFFERYSFIHNPRNGETITSLKATAQNELYLGRDSLVLHSQYQLKNRDRLNKQARYKKHKIPKDLPENLNLNWSRALDFLSGNTIYIPTSLTKLYSPNDESEYFTSNSNGLAVGQTYIEAFLEGFFEVIERDASSIWWYNEINNPHIRPSSIPSDFIKEKLERLNLNGYEVIFIDISTDNKIPVFVSIISRNNAEIAFGFGAHLDSIIAIERSFTECFQSIFFSKRKNRKVTNSFKQWPFLLSSEQKNFLKSPTNYKNINIVIEKLQEQFKHRDEKILIINIPSYIKELKVVKVLIPGYRNLYPQFAPGRLFDLQGYSLKTSEEDLNAFDIK